MPTLDEFQGGKEEKYPTWGELIHALITREKEGTKLNLVE